MIMKSSNVIIWCLIISCLLFIGCSKEDYLLRRGNREAERGNYETAIKFYNEALIIDPRNADLYYNRGLVWDYMNEMEKSITDYTTALEINNEFINAYLNRGITLHKKGDYNFAISDYTKALQFHPNNYSKVGLYFNRAYSWFKMGNYEHAIDDCTESIKIGETIEISSREKAEMYSFRADVWYKKGNIDNAISDYTKAIQINPKYAWAIFSRAMTWHEKREYASAIIDYEKAMELDAEDALVYNNYSWLLSTCPDSKFRDGAKALKLALKAVDINPGEVLFLNTLAAAYAELENFKEAIQAKEKVIVLLKENNKENLKDVFIPQLEFYKAGKPWRGDVKWEDWMHNYEIQKKNEKE